MIFLAEVKRLEFTVTSYLTIQYCGGYLNSTAKWQACMGAYLGLM